MNEWEFMTTKQAADLLQVSVETIRRWVRARQLPAVPLVGQRGYRIRRTELIAWAIRQEKRHLHNSLDGERHVRKHQ